MPGILESDQRWPVLDSASPGSSCLSSELPLTCRRLVRHSTAQRGPYCSYDLAPWLSKRGTQTNSISITSDLLETQILGPTDPRPTELETPGLRPSNLFLQALQVIVKYTKV